MDLPPPVHESSYRINKTMKQAACSVQTSSMQVAAEIEYQMAEPVEKDTVTVRDIDVSVDGSWMTRGHSSKVGVTTAVGCATGKVPDTAILCKTCKSCDYFNKQSQDKNTGAYRRWQTTHRDECTITHTGSAGSMEAKTATEVFGRSITLYNIRYTRFIGDGDTNSFKSVLASNTQWRR